MERDRYSANLILGKGVPDAVLGVLREHNGEILQTTLSGEAESNLRDALGDTGESAS